MPTVPLSLFVDFMLMAGTGRIAHVRSFKKTGDVPSFFKPFIDTLVNAYNDEKPVRAALDEMIFALTDERARRLFSAAERGYLSFVDAPVIRGNKEPTWFIPPMRDYPIGPLTLRTDPEIGLLIDGRPHVLKLYLRGDPINPQQIAITTTLLTSALQTTWPGVTFGVLDVRRGRMFTYRRAEHDIATLMKAEAATFSALYAALRVDQ